MVLETFEQVLSAAEAAGSMTPAWRKFVVTKFFVPIVRTSDTDPRKFTLRLTPVGAGGSHAILISEERERVGAQQESLMAMTGADVVRLLHTEAAILVALSDRAFSIARDKVEWLKKGIEASQARAAAKAREAGAAPAAAAAAAAPSPAPAPKPAPVFAEPPEKRNHRGTLDVGALKPRSVSVARIGLDFYVPGAWRESQTASGQRFTDTDGGSVIDVSGFQRPGLSLAQWIDMRRNLVSQEMPFLTQDGASYRLDGESWRARVQGTATEFTGTFPGDAVESRYLVACIWIDGTVAAFTIKAPAEEFERKRPLYKWLLGRVDIAEAPAAAVYAAPAGRAAASPIYGGETETPPVFGTDMHGRIGRLRAMAYSFPIMGAAMLAAVLGTFMFRSSPIAGGVFMLLLTVATVYTCVRLMVLRLHDVNLSGKWILGFVAVAGIAGALQLPGVISAVSVLFWLAMTVIYCFIPGNSGDNDFGVPSGPNTGLVHVGAGLYILLQVVALAAQLKTGGLEAGAFTNPGASRAQAQNDAMEEGLGVRFVMPGGGMAVNLPDQPQEVKAPLATPDDTAGMLQYQLVNESAVYVMQSISFGRTGLDADGAMDAFKSAAIGSDGVLISEELVMISGNKGRDVRVRLPGQRIRATRFVVAGGKLSVVSIVTSGDRYGMARADAFLASFEAR